MLRPVRPEGDDGIRQYGIDGNADQPVDRGGGAGRRRLRYVQPQLQNRQYLFVFPIIVVNGGNAA